ncbi:hypothetical protein RIF29_18186 [Crotalaria pallida]|uniref:Uncharacterized protein n=1 Tax=Crotalaria pallida TaxID=3830 RepID=A0AAN9FIH6_CROPI
MFVPTHTIITTPSSQALLWQPSGSRFPGFAMRRRRKVQTVQLGGKKKKPRRRVVGLVRMFKRLKLKWLKLHYLRMLRKLKEYYKKVMKDVVEGAATIEAFHQRLLMESSTLAFPLGGVSTTYPSRRLGSDNNNCPPYTFFI